VHAVDGAELAEDSGGVVEEVFVDGELDTV
jgi:hypothetical protein